MSNSIDIFGRYSLEIPDGLRSCKGKNLDRETIMITDEKESFIVYFEDKMGLLDMNYDSDENSPAVNIQCCKYGKYINMRRKTESDYSHFHFELDADDGSVWYLPGTMTVKPGYEWVDGIEPVLMSLLEKINIAEKQSVE